MASFRPGDYVQLHGLQDRPELNGRFGRVAVGEVRSDRVPVHVENSQLLSLRCANLQPSSLKDWLRAIVGRCPPLPTDAVCPTALVSAKRRATTRQLRVCSSNVPPALAINEISDGVQELTGVKSDPHGESWLARRTAMAQQLRAIRATVVLHQELAGAKLEQLLRATNEGASSQLRAVEPAWACAISYDPSMLQPVYADRVMMSSAPNKFLECTCGLGQWVSACRCYKGDGEWRAGGLTYAAFRLLDSPHDRVDLVAVSLHLTNRDPATRARGAREVVAPLAQALGARFDAPVVVGGDFNMTKQQSANKVDKRAGGAGWVGGAYAALVGEHAANRKLLERGGVSNYLQRGRDPDSAYEESGEEEAEGDGAPPLADTWELAGESVGSTWRRTRAVANGCVASTCHNWFGLESRAFQEQQVRTQGVGANSVDQYDDEGEYLRTVSNKDATKRMQPTRGSARYIDWLLVDVASLRDQRVRVIGAAVHTQPGTTDPNVLCKLPTAWGGSKGSLRSGHGSDHFPISVDLELRVDTAT